MKTIKIFLLIGIVAGFAACSNQTQNEEADLAVPVTVEDIKPQSIQQLINTTGTVKATYEAEINSEMSGRYQLMTNPNTGKSFKLGDRVKKGQVIVHFEDEEYLNNINIEAKKLDLDIADNDYEKQSSLFEKGGVTESELRSAEVAKINARNSYEAAMISLSKMDVVAPFTGIITELTYYTPGSKVESGAHMFTVMNYDKMYMEINLPEKYISEVKLGQNAMITNYTIEEDTLYGQISELSPAISSETRTFTGKLQIGNPYLKLRPGMFVKSDIIITQKDSVIVIPKDIIISSRRGTMVYIVERSNARGRRITTGIENQDNVEVTEGLSFNDRLVIGGYETLRTGSKVKVIR